MVGMQNVPKGLDDGEAIQLLITGLEFPAEYVKKKEDAWKVALERAMALGDPEPPKPEYTIREGGLALNYAVIARGGNEPVPTERLFLLNSNGRHKVPAFPCYGKITQLPLQKVFEASERLRLSGKQYGYNFQRIGVLRVSNGPQGVKSMCGYLHANPNPCKDWDEMVTAYDIDTTLEKYSKLVEDERIRLDTWRHDIELLEKMTPEEQDNEVLEGLARRLGLFEILPDGTGRYLKPEIGMSFNCRAKITDKGYFEPLFIEKPAGAKYYNLLTTNIQRPMTEDDVDLAKSIAMAIEQKISNRQMGLFNPEAETEAPLPF